MTTERERHLKPGVDAEPVHKFEKQRFHIRGGDRDFELVEIKSPEFSDALLMCFPGFRIDGEKETEHVHAGMNRQYDTASIRGYGEMYSRDAVFAAITNAIQNIGPGRQVVLHGTSFGAGVIYDFITDPHNRDVLRQYVAGVILETPVLDKRHLSSMLRQRSDVWLTESAHIFGRAFGDVQSHQSSSYDSMIPEALREKTQEKIITLPLHIVFAENDFLVDNEKTLTTLRQQAEGQEVTTETVPHRKGNRHKIADPAAVRNSEAKAVERFCRMTKISS